ncbi:MAG: DUF3160 domain-containing protein [Deltaproteobacteria bacterium]|nr:DUF3160 domain-containing protein [Deltaproteobacteria bacterium]
MNVLKSGVLVFMFMGCLSCNGVTEPVYDNNSTDDSDSETGGSILDNKDIVNLPDDEQEQLAAIYKEYSESRDMTYDDLLTEYPSISGTLDYDPSKAANLDLIQASELALSDEGLAILKENGFAISDKHQFQNIFRGYTDIYAAHLPVYISADAILDSVHKSYDNILADIEESVLITDLETLLTGMRANLSSSSIYAETKKNLDFYLAVALSLANGEVASPVAGADAAKITDFYNKALLAEGSGEAEIFGVSRVIDFSQFKPRGHYEDSETLRQYFRAMIWLGRIDFRMLETQDDGTTLVNREQINATLAFGTLIADQMTAWNRITDVVDLFVGKSDNMTVLEIDDLKKALGVDGYKLDDSLTDDNVKEIILKGGFGAQKILSHLMVNGLNEGTLPLNSSFLLFGQRYVVDSHVFSNLVYDRVSSAKIRLMPSPLDAAFAALKNNRAAELLKDELDKYQYAPDLHMMRTLVESYDEDFWNDNLYNKWLGSLRALSTTPSQTFAGTPAWGKRVLNTQLGSWAELRHDTLLYAKQSYTDIPGCEYPDAYVDPYPEFFKAIENYADKGQDVASLLESSNSTLSSDVGRYFTELAFAAQLLGEMAAQEKDGVPFTEAQLDYINDLIRVDKEDVVCAFVDHPNGWYARLFYISDSALERDPTIADVHTQPADEGGNDVGRILHVATGMPRLMVVTVNNCDGPKAYAGVVFSYFEKITENWLRMSDSEWNEELHEGGNPQDVPWMEELVER